MYFYYCKHLLFLLSTWLPSSLRCLTIWNFIFLVRGCWYTQAFYDFLISRGQNYMVINISKGGGTLNKQLGFMFVCGFTIWTFTYITTHCFFVHMRLSLFIKRIDFQIDLLKENWLFTLQRWLRLPCEVKFHHVH